METQIKNYTDTKTGFKVVQNKNTIQSINKANQVFHEIDTNYLKEGIFYHSWIGYRTNDQIKEVLDGHFIKICLKYHCRKMLIENTRMTGTFSAINDWIALYFMPKLIQSGLTYNAVVLPENVFAQIAVDDLDQKIGSYHSRNFNNTPEALEWLRSV